MTAHADKDAGKEELISTNKGEINLTEHTNHTSSQDPCPGMVD